jgi:uncharacterized membrane protein YhaH (DUF805 family)
MGSLLFSFHGRINRARFWLASLVYFIVGLIIAVIGFVAGQSGAFQMLSFVVNLAVFISGLAVGAKRLHDRDMSGWWLLAFYIVPTVLVAIGVAVGMTSDSWVAMGLCSILAVAIGIWAFVVLGCLRGTIGTNGYGPDPLAIA